MLLFPAKIYYKLIAVKIFEKLEVSKVKAVLRKGKNGDRGKKRVPERKHQGGPGKYELIILTNNPENREIIQLI